MTERITNAIQLAADDPDGGRPALQLLLDEDVQSFVTAAIPLLQLGPDAPGCDLLLKLLAGRDEFIRRLCDPDSFTREASIQLARQIAIIDPRLDTRLVQLLSGLGGSDNPSSASSIERLLELLEAIPSSARIVGPLTRLMRDSNQRVRAKAALLIGRRVQSPGFCDDCLQNQGDARVRANCIESKWGAQGGGVDQLLLTAAKDSNNRVVGNALVGMYRSRDQGAAAKMLAMAVDPRPPFRATAAWAMGQTADRRFLPAMEKLSGDLYAAVRKNAAKAIALMPEPGKAKEVLLRPLWREDTPGGSCRQFVQALGPDDEPVRDLDALRFILWQDRTPVNDYRIIEHSIAEPLAVGFALCQDPGISPQILEGAESAVRGCLESKPPEHQWALARFVSTLRAGEQVSPAEPGSLLADSARLEKIMAEPPVEIKCSSAIAAAMEALLPGVLKARGRRHLILLAPGEFVVPDAAAAAFDRAVENKVAIHAVTTGSPHPSLQSMCGRTHGILSSIADVSELPAAYRRLYQALTHHYEVRFEPQAGAAPRMEVYCEAGYGECELGCWL